MNKPYFILTIFTFIFVVTCTTPDKISYAVITKTALRKEPSLDSDIITILEENTEVVLKNKKSDIGLQVNYALRCLWRIAS